MKLLLKSFTMLCIAATLLSCGKDKESKKLDTTFKLDPTEVKLSAFGGSQTVILGIGKDIESWDFARTENAWYTLSKNTDGISFTVSASENNEAARNALSDWNRTRGSKTDYTLADLYQEWSRKAYAELSRSTADGYRAAWKHLEDLHQLGCATSRPATSRT